MCFTQLFCGCFALLYECDLMSHEYCQILDLLIVLKKGRNCEVSVSSRLGPLPLYPCSFCFCACCQCSFVVTSIFEAIWRPRYSCKHRYHKALYNEDASVR